MTTNYTSKETSQKLEEVFKRHKISVKHDGYWSSRVLTDEPYFTPRQEWGTDTPAFRADTLLELLPKRDYQAESRKFFWEVTLEDTDEWMINFSYSHGMLNDPNLAECAACAVIWLDENNYKFGGKDE